MIKEIKKTKYSSISSNLEQEVKEQEKELDALKKVFELNDIKALNILPLKNIQKSKQNSVRIPKKLNKLEQEKRKELKKLKEVEELNKIQMSLFKEIGRKRNKNTLLNPISQRVPSFEKRVYQTEDFFVNYWNKECDKILGNNKNSSKNKNLNRTTADSDWNKGKFNNNIRLTKYTKKNLKTLYNDEFRKEMNEIKKIMKNSNEIFNDEDEEKDKIFLENLDNNLKYFYLDKTKQIFEFLKDIHLCRYIQNFLNEGLDLFEEFIELPLDFFEKMKNPFLNQKQREKLYQNLSLYKNITTIKKNVDIKPAVKKENIKETNSVGNKEKIKTTNEIGCGNNTIIKKDLKKIKVDNSSNFAVNNSALLPEEFICCWNCLKPLKKENSILKDYNIDKKDNNNSILFKYKYFCSEECIIIFEKEKNTQNLSEIKIKNEMDDENIQIKNLEDNENNNDNINKEDEGFFEGDNYDPMDDF